MQSLGLRIITAAVLLGILAAAEVYANSAPYFLAALALGAWAIAVWEFMPLAHSAVSLAVSRAVLFLIGCTLVLALELLAPIEALLLFIFGVSLLVLVAGRMPSLEKTSSVLLLGVIGAVMFGLGGAGLAQIVSSPAENRAISLWLVGIVVATDVGAYAFGNMFGGVKLAPSISPGKTVAGALSAAALCALVGPLLARVAGVIPGELYLPTVAVTVSLAAQCGDLLESLVKRLAGVKDSGSILPGHGGVFDRIDGLLAAAAVMFFVLR